MKKSLLLVSLLGLGLTLGGCSLTDSLSKKITDKATEKIIENSTGAKVDINNDNNSVSVETKDGSFTVNDDKNLTELKSYVEIPSWITLTDKTTDFIMKSDASDKLSISGSFQSSKSLSDTVDYWQKYIDNNSFTDIGNFSSGSTSQIWGNRGKDTLNISVDGSNSKVTVVIFFSRDKTSSATN